jgi:hypothetical protein
MTPSKAMQDSLKPAKSSVFDPHSLADSDVRPGLAGQARTYQSANGRYLGLVNRNRLPGYPNDRNDPRSLQDWKSVLRVEPAEEVARVQRKFYFLDSIRPPSPAPVSRQKPLIPFAVKASCDDVFVARSNLHGKPRQLCFFDTRGQGSFRLKQKGFSGLSLLCFDLRETRTPSQRSRLAGKSSQRQDIWTSYRPESHNALERRYRGVQ